MWFTMAIDVMAVNGFVRAQAPMWRKTDRKYRFAAAVERTFG
jgi:hypothetical protein